jgi:hypothetical protein
MIKELLIFCGVFLWALFFLYGFDEKKEETTTAKDVFVKPDYQLVMFKSGGTLMLFDTKNKKLKKLFRKMANQNRVTIYDFRSLRVMNPEGKTGWFNIPELKTDRKDKIYIRDSLYKTYLK